MKMISGGTKGIGAALVVFMTYINSTFSPLFWVLLLLIFLDILLNVHKEGQQFQKLASMAASLGIPTYIAENAGQPEIGKYIVAMLCLGYLQIVVPQLVQKIHGLTLSKDPKINAKEQQQLEKLLEMLEAKGEQAAEKVADSTKLATTGAQEDNKGGA